MTTTSALQATAVAGLEVLARPGEGPTVVALPGLSSSGWVWEPLASQVPEADLHAVSLAGRGGSLHATSGPGLAGHADAVAAVVEELDLSDVVLVGHSMGAFLAPLVAQRLVGRVQRLVLVDGGIRPAMPFFLRPGLVRLQFRKELTKAKGPHADAEALLKNARAASMVADRPDLRPAVIQLLERELDGPEGARVARLDLDRLVPDAIDCFFGSSFEPALAALTVPADVLLAENAKKTGQKPFISDKAVAPAVAKQPLLKVQRLPGNHLTVLFDPAFAAAVRG